MNEQVQNTNLILAAISEMKTEFREDLHRLEGRVNQLADQGIPNQVDTLQKRMDILSQRMWALAVGWVFTLAGWAWSLTK